MRSLIEEKAVSKFEKWLVELTTVDGQWQGNFFGRFNEYYPMPEQTSNSVQLMCSDVEHRQPKYDFDGNRLKISVELKKNPFNPVDYCEIEEYLRNTDPRRLFEENDPGRQEAVDKDLIKFEDFQGSMLSPSIFYSVDRIKELDNFDHFWMGRKFEQWTMIYFFTSYTFMKEHCHRVYGGKNITKSPLFYENCALAHVNHQANPEIEVSPIYWDFDNL